MTGTFAELEAGERREAARALLRHPILTEPAHIDALVLVRRHATALKSMFATLLGYPLVVETSFARLIKSPLSADAPARPAQRSSGPFTPRSYAYLALLCAGLLATDVGEQVLLSTLVEQLRADAVTAGLDIEDTHAERRALVAALNLLIEWGVVTETDGSVAGWGERREEALLSVNRTMLPHLLARPLASLHGAADLLAVSPDLVEQPRRSLRRKLVENPLVARELLDDAERDVLSRERTEIARLLADNFGLVVEVRAEGALAYDPDGELSDIEFPGGGTVRWAALMLLDVLIGSHTPRAGHTAAVGDELSPGLFVTWGDVDAALAGLTAAHARSFGADYVSSPALLRGEVARLLTGMQLASSTAAGLVVHPAAARYRPLVQQAPQKTRARQRLEQADGQQPTLSTGTEPST